MEKDSLCVVCYDGSEKLLNFCTDDKCIDKTCENCMDGYITSNITQSHTGFCPTIFCPCIHADKKKKLLNFKKWSENFNEISKKYIELTKQILTILCGSCHCNCTLDVEFKKPLHENTIFLELYKSKRNKVIKLKNLLVMFMKGEISVGDVYNSIKEQLLILSNYKTGLWKEKFMELLSTIRNPERRVNLYLRYLNENPLVFTLCCKQMHCFKCKTLGDHNGRTCEQQLSGLTADIVECPSCQLQLVKSDGCDTVTCVCKKIFSWSLELAHGKSAKQFRVIYPVNTGNNCAKILCDEIKEHQIEAKSWAQCNSNDMWRFLKEWLRLKYKECPSQAAITISNYHDYANPARLYMFMSSQREEFSQNNKYNQWTIQAANSWILDNQSEVAKLQQNNAIARDSLFTTMVQESERPLMAKHLTENTTCWLNDSFDMKTIRTLKTGAEYWIANNRVKYNEYCTKIEENNIERFFRYTNPIISYDKLNIKSRSIEHRYADKFVKETYIGKRERINSKFGTYDIDGFDYAPYGYYSSSYSYGGAYYVRPFQTIGPLEQIICDQLINNTDIIKYITFDHSQPIYRQDGCNKFFDNGNEWVKICGADKQQSSKCVIAFLLVKEKIEKLFNIKSNPYTQYNITADIKSFFDEDKIHSCDDKFVQNLAKNLKWRQMMSAVSWYNNNKVWMRDIEYKLMARNFALEHKENALHRAAKYYSGNLSEYKLTTYEKIAIGYFVANNVGQMDEWYCMDARSFYPLISNIASGCECVPRYLHSCAICVFKNHTPKYLSITDGLAYKINKSNTIHHFTLANTTNNVLGKVFAQIKLLYGVDILEMLKSKKYYKSIDQLYRIIDVVIEKRKSLLGHKFNESDVAEEIFRYFVTQYLLKILDGKQQIFQIQKSQYHNVLQIENTNNVENIISVRSVNVEEID